VTVYVNVPYNALMSPAAVGIGVAVGLLMPIVANVGPISRALQRSLRDSLDKYHSENDAVKVTIIALAKVGLAPWQVVLAILMIVMGFVVYYLMPYSFIFNDIPLFLFLLTIILLGMLLGLSLVAQVLQPSFERVMSWLYMWGGERRRLRPLVLKGLHAHRRRNRKTAMMFTTALAFIIFVGTSFSLQEHSIADNIELGVGSEIAVLSLSDRYPVNKDAMAEYLEYEIARRRRGDADAFVLGYSYQTFELARYPFISRTELSNLAGYPTLRCRIVGIEEHFVDQSYAKFFRPSEVASGVTFNTTRNGQPDIVQGLYTNAGKLRLPIESRRAKGRRAARGRLAGRRRRLGGVWRLAHRRLLAQSAQRRRVQHVHRRGGERGGAAARRDRHRDAAAAHGALQPDAGELDVGDLPRQGAGHDSQDGGRGDVLVVSAARRQQPRDCVDRPVQVHAAPAAQRVGGGGRHWASRCRPAPRRTRWARAGLGGDGPEPKIERLYVRVDPAADDLAREAIINSLRNYIRDDLTQVIDAKALVGSTAFAIALLQYFFIVVTAIAVILCFFVLWLSFTANIRENAWEFGVLRAVGLTAAQVIRVYVYEAAALITSSLVLGTLIGMAQALTLTLQFNLFTELPFTFDFPVALFIVVVVMSFAVAVAGSYFPALKFKRKRIASVLKGQ
jgi:hypothetical protein